MLTRLTSFLSFLIKNINTNCFRYKIVCKYKYESEH